MRDAKRTATEALVANEKRRQAEADIRAVLATPEGRRYFWRLLEKCNLFGASYTDSAAKTAWNEGRRSIAIELTRDARRAAPAEHVLTLSEAYAQQREDESRRREEDARAEAGNANGDGY